MFGTVAKERPSWLSDGGFGTKEAGNPSLHGCPRKLPRFIVSLVLALALCIYTWNPIDLLPLLRRDDGEPSEHALAAQNTRIFSWHKVRSHCTHCLGLCLPSEISPSEVLEYHPCYDGFECARLSVPMEWQGKGNGPKVAVALVRLPAKVSVNDSRYGGPVLINPGKLRGCDRSDDTLIFRRRTRRLRNTASPERWQGTAVHRRF